MGVDGDGAIVWINSAVSFDFSRKLGSSDQTRVDAIENTGRRWRSS